MKIKLLLAMIIAILATAGAGIAKEIVIGTSAIRPPYISIDSKTRKMIGYDAEITEAVMKKLGYTIKWSDMQFDGLIPSLISGKIDIIAAALSVNDERKKKINYSEYYNRIGSKVAILNSVKDINSINDLKTKNVGVVIGTVQHTIAQQNSHLIGKMVEFNGNDELLLALITKNVDAIIENEISVKYALKTGNIKDVKTVGELLNPMDMAFGLRKGEDKLLKEINGALKELKASGEYEKIRKRNGF
jgi:polar amino acid transport system substrate-binding protein